MSLEGRVLSSKTEEDPGHSCDLHEAVIGELRLFDKAIQIRDNQSRSTCAIAPLIGRYDESSSCIQICHAGYCGGRVHLRRVQIPRSVAVLDT